MRTIPIRSGSSRWIDQGVVLGPQHVKVVHFPKRVRFAHQGVPFRIVFGACYGSLFAIRVAAVVARGLGAGALVLLCCGGVGAGGANLLKAGGDRASAPAAVSETSSTAFAARIIQIESALAQAREKQRASDSNAPAGMPAQDASIRQALLQRLVRIYEQQLSSLAELQTAVGRRADLAQQARDWTGFGVGRPYSILLVDGLREAIQTEQVRMRGDQAALSTLDRLVTENRESLARAEERIRLLNEQLENAGSGVSLSWSRELEQIRSRVAVAGVTLLELEREVRQQNLAASRSSLELFRRQLVIARADLKFTQSDLDKTLASLESDRVRLEADLGQAEERHRSALSAVQTARQAAIGSADPKAAELADLRIVQFETAATAVRVLRLLLEASGIERTLWQLRFAAYGSPRAETLRESERQLQTLFRRASLWKEYFRQKLDTTATQVALEESRSSQLEPGSEGARLVQERLSALRERDQWLLRMYRGGERLERLLQRWNEDLERDMGKLPFADRFRNLFSNARSFFSSLWAFELFAAKDTITVEGQKISGKRSVTVGKVSGAILILLAGYWVTGLISEAGRRLLQRWMHVEPNQGHLIRRWMRATLVVCLILFSLVSVKIPLTVFAFAGGALAIGIGFGTQTVLKNVVSGLIILFERPFRVGDVLDVGGQKGTLTNIGLRASVLQLWDGTETLFPNSNLLENALTNWTYSNRVVRFTLGVGVAYGTDTRRVVQILEEVLQRHGLIEKQPQPQILFTDFGPSSLTFELRFWLDVLKTNAAQVCSDLRHMIAGAFAQAAIVIAFPQQDLHLNTLSPLQVQLVNTLEAPPSARELPNGQASAASPVPSVP